jgi:hypothetical protein
MRYTPDNIVELKESEIFCFGSNLAGRHGKGAALIARKKFGAVYGVGEGLTGRCYAIPTKGHNLSRMSLKEIKKHVDIFLEFAKDNPDKKFLVTQIGCGLAGHRPKDIAPMFRERTENVIIPKEFDM